jgi:hypothetical protein
MRKLLILLAFLFPALCSAQGYRFDSQISSEFLVSTTAIPSLTNVLTIPASAIVAFCNFPANAVPCTNKATTYTSVSLGTSCPTSTQIVLSGTTSCVASPDAQENWGVWVPSGQYSYTISIAGVNFGPYVVNFGVPSGTNLTLGTVASCTVNGTYVVGSTCYATIASAVAAAPSGATVYVPCGTYSISSTITLTQPIVIQGQAPAANFNIGSTQFGAYTPCVKILWTGVSGTPMMSATNLTGIKLYDLTFDGGSLASIGLQFQAIVAPDYKSLLFTNFVAGNANDSALEAIGGSAGTPSNSWGTMSDIAMNNVVKGFHVWSGNTLTDTFDLVINGMWCTLVSGAGDYCVQVDAGDNFIIENLYGAFVSGSTGSCVTLNDVSGNNDGARSIYFIHPGCNPSMTFVSNVASSTGLNFVYGYDKSNGMPSVTGTHAGSLVFLGSTDVTQMLRLPNGSIINFRNAADSADIQVLKLDGSNSIIFGAGTGGSTQIWNAARSSIIAQFNDTSLSLNKDISLASSALLVSQGAPVVASGFNTGTVSGNNGTASFFVTVGTAAGTSTGVLTMPGAANGWNCFASNQTRADFIAETANTANSVTLTNYGVAFGATNFTNSDVIIISCMAR